LKAVNDRLIGPLFSPGLPTNLLLYPIQCLIVEDIHPEIQAMAAWGRTLQHALSYALGRKTSDTPRRAARPFRPRLECLECRCVPTTTVVTEQVVHAFGSTATVPVVGGAPTKDGLQPEGDVTLSTDGTVLYGRTFTGGSDGLGNIFQVNTDGTGYETLHNFTGETSNLQTTDGAQPRHNAMVLSPDGSILYGMTVAGGTGGVAESGNAPGMGVVFRYELTGANPDTFSLVHVWQGGTQDGEVSHGSLVLTGSTLYGMTEMGGAQGKGVLFAMSADPADVTTLPTILWNFGQDSSGKKTDGFGAEPHGTPILVTFNGDQHLYGLTRKGGVSLNGSELDDGVLFDYDLTLKQMTTLHTFLGSPLDGATPFHGIPKFANGVLYGMTTDGGHDAGGNAADNGVIFSYDLNPNDPSPYKVLHYFGDGSAANDGVNPDGSVTIIGNQLYGVTTGGGLSGQGALFRMNLDGMGYQILYSFQGTAGDHPIDSLTPLVHPDGSITLYGMTQQGGDPATNGGVIFAVTVADVPSSAGAASTSVALTGVQVTPSLSGETVALAAQVSSPAGTVNQGTASFSVAGRTVSAPVNANGQATASIGLPAFTTVRPLTFVVDYTDASDFAASSGALNVPFIPIDALLPSSVSPGGGGAQTVTDSLFGLLALGRTYNAQDQLTGLSVDGVALVRFAYNPQGQLTSLSIGDMQLLALSYNSRGQLTSVLSPALTEVFFYTPQGLFIGSMTLGH
jgi:uncharacterized repeat protein (TIGR03803 family)/YD repeat-containing protein